MSWIYKADSGDDDKVEIVRYGLELAILKAVFLIASLLISLILRELVCYIIFIVFFMPLRSLVGGYHAKTRLICFIESMTLVIAVCGLSKLYSYGFMHIPLIFLTLLVPAAIMILVLSPVESDNKALSPEQKSSFRIRIRIYVIIYVIVIALLFVFGKTAYALPVALAVNSSAILVIIGYTQNKRLV
jgi:accessory gene regulator B